MGGVRDLRIHRVVDLTVSGPAKLARALITVASGKNRRRLVAGGWPLPSKDLKAQIEAHRQPSTSLAFD